MLKLSGKRDLLSRTGIYSTSTLSLFPALITETANGRFLTDYGVHPIFWSFIIIDATSELERSENDIPSILYSSMVLPTSSLWSSFKVDRERVKANYESGLIVLDG
jgi:hypothetical protein